MARPFTIHNEESRKQAIDLVAALDITKPWHLTVEPRKRRRSIDQNSLYHKWVSIVAEETGNTHDDVHEWAKSEFLPPSFAMINGVAREYRPSTTKLTTAEMSAYMDKFNAWASSELGLILPHPEDMGRA